jgi:hypothetical protein
MVLLMESDRGEGEEAILVLVGAACYSNSGYLVPFLEQSLPYKE